MFIMKNDIFSEENVLEKAVGFYRSLHKKIKQNIIFIWIF